MSIIWHIWPFLIISKNVTYVPFLVCYPCLYTISNLLFYMLLSLLAQKKVTKEMHPKIPLRLQRSSLSRLEKSGRGLTRFAQTEPALPLIFPALFHQLLRGPYLVRCQVTPKGAHHLLAVRVSGSPHHMCTSRRCHIMARYLYFSAIIKKEFYFRNKGIYLPLLSIRCEDISW